MKNNTPTRAVIFDIGGVFIGLDFSRAVRRTAAATGLPIDDVKQRLFGENCPLLPDRSEYMNAYECGRINDAEFHRSIERTLEARFPFAEFKAAWNDIFLEPIADTLHLAESLLADKSLTVGILSNNNALHWSALQPLIPALKKFEHVFLSHEIGLKKPDAEAFQHALKRMSLRADETVFVDDLKENIAAAEGVGMKSVHATDARAVREGIKRHGVRFLPELAI